VKPSIPLRPAAVDVAPPADTTARIVQLDLPGLPSDTLRPTTVDRLAAVRSGLDTDALLELYSSRLPADFAVHARFGRLLQAYHLPTGMQATTAGDVTHVTFPDGAPSIDLQVDGDKVHTATFSPDGSLLAGGAVDGGLSVWEMPSGESLCSIYRNPVQVKALTFNHQSSLLAVGYDDLTIELYSIPDCGRVMRLPATTRHINDLEFSPDDTILISAAADTSAQVFELSTGRLLDRLEPDHAKKGLHALSIHPGQVILAVGSYEGVLTFFNLRTGQFLARYRPGTVDNPITDLVFTTGGESLLVHLADDTWVVYAAPG
jgi:WD40 repeat protein